MGAHGVRGDVKVKSFTADPSSIFDYGPLLTPADESVLEPAQVRPQKNHFIVTARTGHTREDWEALKGQKLCVPRNLLPDPDDDEFYIDDLTGLEVFAGGEAALGRVKAVQNYGAGDLLEVLPVDGGASVFIPFTAEDVPVVSLQDRRIVVASWDLWSGNEDAPETDRS